MLKNHGTRRIRLSSVSSGDIHDHDAVRIEPESSQDPARINSGSSQDEDGIDGILALVFAVTRAAARNCAGWCMRTMLT